MPRFKITALEKFIVKTEYEVEADDRETALSMCQAGEVGYDKAEIQEGDEEWLEHVEIEES